MVGKWRARFVADRLAGLSDDDRPGRPRTITDAQVEQVVTATLEQAPPDAGTHWSTRMMAARTGLTQTAVSRIWRAFALKPHKVDYWKLSTDPNFVGKLYDVVGLYLDPPERALVLCVDEKSQVQALDRSAPVLPMMPAAPERQTHTYIRHGTTSLFAALDVNGLAFSLLGSEAVDLEAAGDPDDAGLIFAGGEVAGLLGGSWAGPVGPVVDEEGRVEDLEQEGGDGQVKILRGESPP